MFEIRVVRREQKFGGWIKVDAVELSHRQGIEKWSPSYEREVVECGDAVGVLLQDEQSKELVLVRQVRVALERHGEINSLEIVAGKIDAGETPERAARREVSEEVHLQLANLTSICSVFPSPGVLSEVVHIFFAEFSPTGAIRGQSLGSEVIEPVFMSINEAWAAVKSGQIRDAKTVIALQWLRGRTS